MKEFKLYELFEIRSWLQTQVSSVIIEKDLVNKAVQMIKDVDKEVWARLLDKERVSFEDKDFNKTLELLKNDSKSKE